jgi:hypothetical protein
MEFAKRILDNKQINVYDPKDPNANITRMMS